MKKNEVFASRTQYEKKESSTGFIRPRYTGVGDLTNIFTARCMPQRLRVVGDDLDREQKMMILDMTRHQCDVVFTHGHRANVIDAHDVFMREQHPTHISISDNERIWMQDFLGKEAEKYIEGQALIICPNTKGERPNMSWSSEEWIQLIEACVSHGICEKVCILPHFDTDLRRDTEIAAYCDTHQIPVYNVHQYIVDRQYQMQKSQALFGHNRHDICSYRQFATIVALLGNNTDASFVSNDTGPAHVISAAVAKNTNHTNVPTVISVNTDNVADTVEKYTPRNGGITFTSGGVKTEKTNPQAVAAWLVASNQQDIRDKIA